FTDQKIARAYQGFVTYANDAMGGLELAKKIQDPALFASLRSQVETRQKEKSENTYVQISLPEISQKRSSTITPLAEIPSPPDLERHVLLNTSIDLIWDYLNPLMLYSRHLGMKGKLVKLLEAGDLRGLSQEPGGDKAIELYETLQALKQEVRALLKPKAIYQFFQAQSEGNRILLQSNSGQQETLSLPRQITSEGLCLADYVASDPHQKDHLALFVVGVGEGVRELAEQWKQEGKYLKSHAFAALALESAEAYAEFLHARIRNMWGFPDGVEMTMMQRFQAKYRGKRYSFGYPACPNLEDQKVIWNLLKPEEIGIQLTDGFMMEPEASVSALVFHHPQATYFSVGEE
ncbi:MAG: methionine synthase, partial [Deltaproteobacteria bacterium]|nr:methionine synthase [Deltaproteobacteria bacterium]